MSYERMLCLFFKILIFLIILCVYGQIQIIQTLFDNDRIHPMTSSVSKLLIVNLHEELLYLGYLKRDGKKQKKILDLIT